MTRKSALEIIGSGKFCSVSFATVDGREIKQMVCRTGVKKHLKGGVKATPKDLITVYSMDRRGYRSISPERILSVNGKQIR